MSRVSELPAKTACAATGADTVITTTGCPAARGPENSTSRSATQAQHTKMSRTRFHESDDASVLVVLQANLREPYQRHTRARTMNQRGATAGEHNNAVKCSARPQASRGKHTTRLRGRNLWDPSSLRLPKETKLLRAFQLLAQPWDRRRSASRRKQSSSEPSSYWRNLGTVVAPPPEGNKAPQSLPAACNVVTHRRHTSRGSRDHCGPSRCGATFRPPVASPPEGDGTADHRSAAIPRRKRVRLQQPTLARLAVRCSRHASAANSPESRMHEQTTRPSMTPAGCVHPRRGERAGVSKPRSVSTRGATSGKPAADCENSAGTVRPSRRRAHEQARAHKTSQKERNASAPRHHDG
jgi:hypothetical protein